MKYLSLILLISYSGLADAKPQKYWTCIDADGHKTAQDVPCPEPEKIEQTPPISLVETSSEIQQVTPQIIRKTVQAKPVKDHWTGALLKPLLPLVGMIALALLGVGALKIWLTFRIRSAHDRRAKKTDRIEPSKELAASYSKRTGSQRASPTAWSLDLIRALEWKRFEELCEGYWSARGYRAELTGIGADGGVDVKLYAPSEPQKLFAVIQCKSWTGPVGVTLVRELWGVASHHGVRMAIFYGLSGFTEDAKSFAADKHFKLFAGQDLLEQIKTLSPDQQQTLLEHVTRGDYTTPSCSQCDVKMELKEAKVGSPENRKFWSCTNFPRCRQTLNLATR